MVIELKYKYFSIFKKRIDNVEIKTEIEKDLYYIF